MIPVSAVIAGVMFEKTLVCGSFEWWGMDDTGSNW
jgi:hypothetical protein